MKKLLLTLTIVAALALGIFGLTACGKDKDGGLNGTGNSAAAEAAEAAYGFSAASAGALLSSMNAPAAPAARNLAAQADSTQNGAQTDGAQAEIDELNGYMLLVEGILDGSGVSAAAEKSDREGYAVKMTVAYKDLEGDSIEYAVYYNETLVHEEYDNDDDDDEREQVYRLDGVMRLNDGSEYAVEGRRSVESERGESESEEQFRVRIDEARTLLVEHEAEQERGESETEYEYTLYENGRMVRRSTFSCERERGETEIELKLFNGGEGKAFYFEEEKGRISVKVGDRNGTARYFVTVDEDGNYLYETADGGKYRKHRFDPGD